MNKTFLLLLTLLALCSTAASQSRFGLKAGVNIANQDKTFAAPQVPSHKTNTRPYAGYQLGAFYKAKLYGPLGVSVEPAFSVIGSGMTLVSPDGKSYDAHEKLGYIELPVLVQYRVKKGYLGAGPSAGLMVLSKLTGFEDRSFDISYYRKTDVAANVLAGYSVREKLDINVRYSYGLMNLYEGGYSTAKNRFVNLSVLYSFK